jgi:hypothetical protein
MEFLNQLNSVNVQMPVGYVLLAMGLFWSGWKLTMLAYRAIVSLAAKVSFAMLGSGVLVLGGLTGSGYSVGEFVSGPEKPQPPSETCTFSNSDLSKLVTNNNADKEKLTIALEYAKERDKLLQKQPRTVQVAPEDGKSAQPKPSYSPDYKLPASLLAASIGMILCGAVWFFRE